MTFARNQVHKIYSRVPALSIVVARVLVWGMRMTPVVTTVGTSQTKVFLPWRRHGDTRDHFSQRSAPARGRGKSHTFVDAWRISVYFFPCRGSKNLQRSTEYHRLARKILVESPNGRAKWRNTLWWKHTKRPENLARQRAAWVGCLPTCAGTRGGKCGPWGERCRRHQLAAGTRGGCLQATGCVRRLPTTDYADRRCSRTPYTWAEKFESFERIKSIRETNGNFDSCNYVNGWFPAVYTRLHESKFPFVSRIEFIRSKLSNFFCSCIRGLSQCGEGSAARGCVAAVVSWLQGHVTPNGRRSAGPANVGVGRAIDWWRRLVRRRWLDRTRRTVEMRSGGPRLVGSVTNQMV